MSELNIKNLTMEEFKKNFNLINVEGLVKYPVTELASLMAKGSDKAFYLVDGNLYEEPIKEVEKKEFTEEDINIVEELHDKYRDNLVEYREYLYYRNGESDSEEAKQIKAVMNECINQAKEILKAFNIKDSDDLKNYSNKFFIPDFLNILFDVDDFNIIDEIDCGL